MKKSKFIVLIMVVFSLSLGGCSFFNGQSAKKQEMIQIAESKKMKVAIEEYLKNLINNDEKLILSTTIQEDATTGKYEETYFGETEELSDLLDKE